METYGLEALGIINASAVYHNLTPAQLTEHALRRGEGKLSNTGALVVKTGKYTGRSANDKFIVDTPAVHDEIAWGKVNRPIEKAKFDAIKSKVIAYLQGKEIFIFDGFAGADPKYTQSFRIVNELASQNLFIHQLLRRPTAEQLKDFKIDYTIIAAPGFKCIPEVDGTRSEAAILVDYEEKLVVICGTQYAGEIKKSVFSVMNYVLPKMGVFPMHCSANIVNAANSLIAHNSGRIPKECRSATGNKGELIKLLSCNDERDEAMSIVSEILSCIRKTSASYEDFAVLYRTNAQSRAIEEQLRRRNIPYLIYSGNSFFERAEVKDLMAYFKLAVNPLDDESFKRIVNKPARGIGDTTLAGLATAAQVRQTTLFRAVYLDDIESFGVKPAAVAKLKSFCSMIDSFHTLVPQTDAYELATKIADESGLYASFKADNSIEGQSRVSNIEELVNSVMLFVNEQREQSEDEEALFTLDIFLEDVSLLSNVDTSDPDESGNKVALMTVHTAKGLEFPYVFIAGMEEHLFPSYSEEMAISPEDLEEERRLFYVALTRAEREVWIAFADSRMRNGRTSSNPPSRFVREIDSRYIANPLDEDQFSPASWGGFGSRGFRSEAGSGRNAYLRNSASGGTAFSGRSAAADRSSSSDRIAAFPSRSSDSAVQRKPSTTAAKAARYADFVPVPMTELYVGERIEHNTFGAGIILEITGTVPELRAKVRFDELGEKLLLLKYAKLRPEQK